MSYYDPYVVQQAAAATARRQRQQRQSQQYSGDTGGISRLQGNYSVYTSPEAMRQRSTFSDRSRTSQGYGQGPDTSSRSAYYSDPRVRQDLGFNDPAPASPGTESNWLRSRLEDNAVRDFMGSGPGVVGTAGRNIYDYVTNVPAARFVTSLVGGTFVQDTAAKFQSLLDTPQDLVNWWNSPDNYLNPTNLNKIEQVYGSSISPDQQRQALEAFTSQMPDGANLLKDLDAISSGQYGQSVRGGGGRLARDPRTGLPYTDSKGNPLGSTKIKRPGDPGYIDYGDPRNMDPTRMYRRLEDITDEGSALNMSDEEWEKATEEERQANFEARQKYLDENRDDLEFITGTLSGISSGGARSGYRRDDDSLLNFNVDAPSPFGEFSFKNKSTSYLADIENQFLRGEISETQLNRYLDDVSRSTGATMNPSLKESMDLLEAGGFTDKEIQQFAVEYATVDPNTGEFRSDEEYFDYFDSVVDQIDFEDPEMRMEAYDMYDTRREEDYRNSFFYLDLNAGTDAFNEAFETMDTEMQNAYLDHLKDSGQLEESVYREMVAQNLTTEDQKFFYLPGTDTIAMNESGSPYESYRILQFDQLDEDYDSPSRIEGFTDEQNERRATIAMLDAGNVSFSDVQKGMPRPKKKKWYEDPIGALKDFGESWFFGGLKEIGPSVENILKGEATTGDYLNVVPFGLEMTEVLTPGVSVDEAQELGESVYEAQLANGMSEAVARAEASKAYDLARAGKGFDFGELGTLDYNRSVALTRATITGDLDKFLAGELADRAFTKTMDELGKTEIVQSMSPIAKEATRRTLVDLANGRSLEESLKEQALEYGEDILDEFLPEIEDGLREAGRKLDDNVLQKIKESIPLDVERARAFLRDFDEKAGISDALSAGADFIEDNIIDPADDFIDRVGEDYVDPALQEAEEFVDDLVESLPDGPDLPETDAFDGLFDDLDLPDLSGILGALAPLAGIYGGPRPPFGEEDEDDLFEFDEPYDFSGDSVFRDAEQEKRFGITDDRYATLDDINELDLNEFNDFRNVEDFGVSMNKNRFGEI